MVLRHMECTELLPPCSPAAFQFTSAGTARSRKDLPGWPPAATAKGMRGNAPRSLPQPGRRLQDTGLVHHPVGSGDGLLHQCSAARLWLQRGQQVGPCELC